MRNYNKPYFTIKEKMKSFGYPIIYVNDHYQLWRSDIDQLITHCTNEYSENIIHKIAPSFDEYILLNHIIPLFMKHL